MTDSVRSYCDNKLSKIRRSADITKATKIVLMRMLIFPVFLCGSEAWVINIRDQHEYIPLECGVGWEYYDNIGQQKERINLYCEWELNKGHRLLTVVYERTLEVLWLHYTLKQYEQTSFPRKTDEIRDDPATGRMRQLTVQIKYCTRDPART